MSGENAYRQPVTLKNVLMFSVPTIVMTVFMSFFYHGGRPVCI